MSLGLKFLREYGPMVQHYNMFNATIQNKLCKWASSLTIRQIENLSESEILSIGVKWIGSPATMVWGEGSTKYGSSTPIEEIGFFVKDRSLSQYVSVRLYNSSYFKSAKHFKSISEALEKRLLKVDHLNEKLAPMEAIRALSIRQPFAELIVTGEKKFEYRSIPTKIRERVFIYASKKPAPKKEWQKTEYEPFNLPTGVIVGTVEIVGCKKRADGSFAWKLSRPGRTPCLLKPKRQPQPVWFKPF